MTVNAQAVGFSCFVPEENEVEVVYIRVNSCQWLECPSISNSSPLIYIRSLKYPNVTEIQMMAKLAPRRESFLTMYLYGLPTGAGLGSLF